MKVDWQFEVVSWLLRMSFYAWIVMLLVGVLYHETDVVIRTISYVHSFGMTCAIWCVITLTRVRD